MPKFQTVVAALAFAIVAPAQGATNMVVSRPGMKPFTIAFDAGTISADGKVIAEISPKTGIISAFDTPAGASGPSTMIGQITSSGHFIERSTDRGAIDKGGVIRKGRKDVVGRIDDDGTIFAGDKKWGQVSDCGADFKHKRLVAAFLAFFTNDFLQAPPAPSKSEPVAGIQIDRGSVHWAFIDEQGTISLESGGRAGAIDAHGNVTNDAGNPLGSIDSHGKITNASGQHHGEVRGDGQMLDDSGRRTWKIEKNGTIQSKNGPAWGEAGDCCQDPGKLRQVAAALIFFAQDP